MDIFEKRLCSEEATKTIFLVRYKKFTKITSILSKLKIEESNSNEKIKARYNNRVKLKAMVMVKVRIHVKVRDILSCSELVNTSKRKRIILSSWAK